MRLKDQIAIVTGAGRNIGEDISKLFVEEGAKVAVVDLDQARGNSVAAAINGKNPGKAIGVVCDVSSPSSVDNMVQTVVKQFGRVDILVNNAGIQYVAPITEFPLSKWHEIIEIMLTAPFLLTKEVLPGMYDRKWGRVINIASVHALRASAYKSAYVAAKHGLLGLTRVTALEGAEYGVTCNAICPSYVRTALVEKQIASQAEVHGIPETEVVEKIMLAEAPIRRLLEPSEVSKLAAYLCSDDASGITGSALTIDCGWTAH